MYRSGDQRSQRARSQKRSEATALYAAAAFGYPCSVLDEWQQLPLAAEGPRAVKPSRDAIWPAFWMALAFCIFLFLELFFGLREYRELNALRSNGRVIQAEVTELKISHGRASVGHSVTYQFAVDGRTYAHTAGTSSDIYELLRPGSKIEVTYLFSLF